MTGLANLQRPLSTGKVLPFVGAGVSMAARNSNSGNRLLPSWKQALKNGVSRARNEGALDDPVAVEKKIEVEDLTIAAREIRRALGPDQWYRFLQDQFHRSRELVDEDSLEMARAVWDLGSRVVATTNYDDVLGWACPSPNVACWQQQSTAELATYLSGDQDDPAVWHVHGHIGTKSNIILTLEKYAELYPDQNNDPRYVAAISALRAIIMTKSLLFVGFSLRDQKFLAELTNTAKALEGWGREHFALLPEDEGNRDDELESAGVRAIYYPNPDGDHKELLNLLKELAQSGRAVPTSPRGPHEEHGDAFVARDEESAQIAKLLREGGERFVEIIAPSGCGKTRLSQRVSTSLLESFEGRVRFADLSEVTDADELGYAVARALGVVLTGCERPGQSIANLLEHHERTLVVLDHFEQLIHDAGNGERPPALDQVRTWSEVDGEVAFLATSTLPLGIGSQVDLASLSYPDLERIGELTPPQIGGFPAVHLYAWRRHELDARFELTGTEARTAGRLCARLRGLPLAIELAARQEHDRKHVEDQLDDAFDDVAKTGCAEGFTAELEAILRVCLWNLKRAERDALIRLSVCNGGFFATDARAMLGDEHDAHADELITRLCRLGLLRREGTDYDDRLSVPPSIRLWLAERTVKPQDEKARAEATKRHREHYLLYAERCATKVDGKKPGRALERLELEIEDLEAIYAAAIEASDIETAARALLVLAPVARIRGSATRLAAYAKELLPQLGDEQGTLRARLLIALSECAGEASELTDAEDYSERAVQGARAVGDVRVIADALRTQAKARFGKPSDATLELADEAIGLYAQAGDVRGQAWAHGVAGRVLSNWGGYEHAIERFDQARGLADPLKGTLLQCELSRWRADALSNLDRYDEALIELDRAEKIATKLGYDSCRWTIRNSRAIAHSRQGDVEKAVRQYQELRRDARLRGDRYREALATANLADAYRRARQVAADRTREAIGIYEKLGMSINRAEATANLAAILRDDGQGEEALAVARQAYDLCEEAGTANTLNGWLILATLAQIEATYGDEARARELVGKALESQRFEDSKNSEVQENWTALIEVDKALRNRRFSPRSDSHTPRAGESTPAGAGDHAVV